MKSALEKLLESSAGLECISEMPLKGRKEKSEQDVRIESKGD